MSTITFIHTADLHLDSPFVGLKTLPKPIYQAVQQSTFQSFSTIVDKAIEKKVDFVIIAGDLFDLEDRSIRAQIFFRREMERLQQANIATFVVHGNHDHLSGSWTELPMPENVHIFPGHVETIPFLTKNGIKVHFYGFSYPKRHLLENMTDQYRKKDGADYHIGILHGHDRTNSGHYPYAPFSISELLKKDFDYWALGHIHQASKLHEDPVILYPGNIQGRHRQENGKKGCYYVTLGRYGTKLEFMETAPIVWLEKEIITNEQLESFDALYNTCIKMKEELRQAGKAIFLQIVVDEEKVASPLHHWLYNDEFLELLQEGEERLTPFIWIYGIKVKKATNHNRTFNGLFFSELEQIAQGVGKLDEALAPLFDHPRTKKFIDPLTPEEEKEIKEQALRIIAEYLKG